MTGAPEAEEVEARQRAEGLAQSDRITLRCPLPGQTLYCIYERKGDELRLCYALFGTDRPTEFTSGPGSRHILMTYRRTGDK